MKLYDHRKVIFTYNPAKDGFIEIRKGALFLSLGGCRYVQGRILLDNGRYIRGLMSYSNDVPDGYDIRVNFMTWKTFWCSIFDLNSDKPFKHPNDRTMKVSELEQLDNGCVYKIIDKDENDWMPWSNNFRMGASKIIGRKPRDIKELKKEHEDMIEESIKEIANISNPAIRKEMRAELLSELQKLEEEG